MGNICNISRFNPVDDGQGGFGEEWIMVWANIPCRFAMASASTAQIAERIAHVQQFKLTVPYDQDILVGDRVHIPDAGSQLYEVTGVSANTYDTAKRCNLVAIV